MAEPLDPHLLPIGKTLRVQSWEELYSLPNFQTKISHNVVKVGKFMWRYGIPGKVLGPCAISSCRTRHFHGIVVRLEDGSLTGIGRKCGAKYFPDWAQHLAEFAASEAEVRLGEQIDDLRASAAKYGAQLAYFSPQIARYAQLRKLLDAIPSTVLSEIRTKTERRDLSVTWWSEMTDEEFQRERFRDGSLRRSDRRQRSAELSPASFLIPGKDPSVVAQYEIAPAIRRVVDSEKLPPHKLRELGRELSALAGKFNIVERSLKDFDRFLSEHNLLAITKLPTSRGLGVRRISFDAGILAIDSKHTGNR